MDRSYDATHAQVRTDHDIKAMLRNRLNRSIDRRTVLLSASGGLILAMGGRAMAAPPAIGRDIEMWDGTLVIAGIPTLVTVVVRLGSLGKQVWVWIDNAMKVEKVYKFCDDLLGRWSSNQEAISVLASLVQGDGPHALRGAAEHPYRSPAALARLADFTSASWYPLEVACCGAFSKRFGVADPATVQASGLLDLQPDQNVVLFGSQVSNLVTRLVFGNPFVGDDARFDVPVKAAMLNRRGIIEQGWNARLRWNLHSGGTGTIERTQFGERWVTRDHYIADRETGQSFTPSRGNGAHKLDDYLLVTRLPRRQNTRGPAVISFSGVHGAGTLASILLLGNPPLEDLTKLQELTKGQRYYQALFRVDLREGRVPWSTGLEQVPTRLSLVDATHLVISKAR